MFMWMLTMIYGYRNVHFPRHEYPALLKSQ